MLELFLLCTGVNMSAFTLKLIAILSMVFDHSGYIIFNGFSFFNYIGRFAFPIFAFQISEGYLHTKNLKRYFLRLIIFAFISQVPYMLFHSIISSGFALNIFFTLVLGLASITCYDKIPNKFLGILSCTFLAIIAEFCNMDYGAYGIAIIVLFYIFKENALLMPLSFIIATLFKYITYIIKLGFADIIVNLWIFTTLSIIFISFYNGKKGKDIKYILYIFYPLHLLVIYLISLIK